MFGNRKVRLRLFARVSAMVLVCHFVIGLVVAASPGLHKYLHPDFDVAEHACFATTMATGSCDSPGTALTAIAFVPEILPSDDPPETCWVEPVFLAGALLVHAPPHS